MGQVSDKKVTALIFESGTMRACLVEDVLCLQTYVLKASDLSLSQSTQNLKVVGLLSFFKYNIKLSAPKILSNSQHSV